MDVQPEVSEVAHAVSPEGDVDSPKDADEFSQDVSSEIIIDVASDLPEPSLPSRGTNSTLSRMRFFTLPSSNLWMR